MRLAVDEPTAAVLRTLTAGIEDALAAPLAAIERRMAALEHALAALERGQAEVRRILADLHTASARGGAGTGTTAGVGLGATPWTEGEA